MEELTKEEQMEVQLLLTMRKGSNKILFGFLWLIGGIIVTWITIASDFPYIIMFWGAILFGFIDMLYGLYIYLPAKYKHKKLNQQRMSGEISFEDESGEASKRMKIILVIMVIIACLCVILAIGALLDVL